METWGSSASTAKTVREPRLLQAALNNAATCLLWKMLQTVKESVSQKQRNMDLTQGSEWKFAPVNMIAVFTVTEGLARQFGTKEN